MSIFLIFIFIFGAIIGSFLNCLIWRIYKNETILGRSYCPDCRHNIPWYDNIPVLSFLFLRGKCRFCKKDLSLQYPVVEIVTGLLFVLSFYFNFYNDFSYYKLFFDFLLISVLMIVFVFDFRWYLIPVQVLIYSAIFLLPLNIFIGFSFYDVLLAFFIGTSFFLFQYLLTKGRGIGEGDIWLGGFLGIAFPALSNILLLLFLTYIIGGFVALVLIILGLRKLGAKLPLGIFLSIAAIITLFWSNEIISWYFSLMI
jgi:prepilin signal peptidase PulO-like enzyme (type II secretory pathway)